MELNLLPCPFCGGVPEAELVKEAAILLSAVNIICSGCGARKMVESSDFGHNSADLYRSAQMLWNRRIAAFQWIPVKERLPEWSDILVDEVCAIVIADGRFGIGEYLYRPGGGWSKYGISPHYNLQVTRWMEMPT